MERWLYHYGMKGMRWGVRKYQNPDGSLTAAGRRRYGAGDLGDKSDEELRKVVQRKNLEDAYRKATKSDADEKLERDKKLIDAARNQVDAVSNLDRRIPSRKRGDMDLSNMTDREMREAINRKLLERQYSEIFSDPARNRGRERMRTVLDASTAALGVASSALGIALAIRNLRQ